MSKLELFRFNSKDRELKEAFGLKVENKLSGLIRPDNFTIINGKWATVIDINYDLHSRVTRSMINHNPYSLSDSISIYDVIYNKLEDYIWLSFINNKRLCDYIDQIFDDYETKGFGQFVFSLVSDCESFPLFINKLYNYIYIPSDIVYNKRGDE